MAWSAGSALPFVVLGSRPGLEILHPLAVVLLSGLLTAALVTLFFLPRVYRHAGPPPNRWVGRTRGRIDRAERGMSRGSGRGLTAVRIESAGFAGDALTACTEVETATPEGLPAGQLSPPDESGVKDVTLDQVAANASN